MAAGEHNSVQAQSHVREVEEGLSSHTAWVQKGGVPRISVQNGVQSLKDSGKGYEANKSCGVSEAAHQIAAGDFSISSGKSSDSGGEESRDGVDGCLQWGIVT